MDRLPEPYEFYDRYCEEQEREIARRPICECCEEPILDETCISFGDGFICENCLDTYYRIATPDDY